MARTTKSSCPWTSRSPTSTSCPRRLPQLFEEVENNPAHGQPEYFFSNHDQPRQWDRYGDGMHNDQIAKLMATLAAHHPRNPADVLRRGNRHAHHRSSPHRGRPRPHRQLGLAQGEGPGWRAYAHAVGYLRQRRLHHLAKPWLPIPPMPSTYNVETEKKDPNSIFNTYRRLLALRKSEPALRNGSYQAVDEKNPYVFSYLRQSGGSTVLVFLNMSTEPRTVSLNLAARNMPGTTAVPLYSAPTSSNQAIPLEHISLAPFGVLVAKVQ